MKRCRFYKYFWCIVLCMACFIGGIAIHEKKGSMDISQAKTVSPVKKYGKLTVSGTALVGENGKKIQIKGVSTHGINWYPQYVNKKTFKHLRDSWKVNAVRLAMYTEEYNGYCSGGDKKELKKTVCKGVDALTELGMYAIIDWHILSDGNPNTHVKDAKKFFSSMAKKYKDQNNVIYEICNEPNGGTTWSQIRKYAKKIIPVIRKQNQDAIIIVGTPSWDQEADKAVENPLSYDNILYALHFYSATHKTDLRKVAKEALKSGLPLFVSEFGICDASGNGSVDKKEAEKWLKLLKKYHAGYVIWNLSNKDESSALIKSDCTKLSGWTSKELTVEGRWYKKW